MKKFSKYCERFSSSTIQLIFIKKKICCQLLYEIQLSSTAEKSLNLLVPIINPPFADTADNCGLIDKSGWE